MTEQDRKQSQNTPERSQEPQEGPRRWEDVLFPSYRSEPASGRSQRLQTPRWLQRQQGKDLSGYLKDGAE